MRAVVQTGFGDVDVLELRTVPAPRAMDGALAVEVSTAGVNYTDTQLRRTGLQTTVADGAAPRRVTEADLPLIPGAEVVGLSGGRRLVGLCGSGGYAEVALLPADLAFDVPDGVTDEVALALFVQGLTAWHLCHSAGRVATGDTVIVHGGAGGVGSIAIQLARLSGAGFVVATASSAEKRAWALELGADRAVDSAPESLGAKLLDAAGGRLADVIFDMAGGEVFNESLRCLGRFGRIVTYGSASGTAADVNTRSLLVGSRALVGVWLLDYLRDRGNTEAALRELFHLVERGDLRTLASTAYTLADAAQAQLDVEARKTVGKVVLEIGPRS